MRKKKVAWKKTKYREKVRQCHDPGFVYRGKNEKNALQPGKQSAKTRK
jgi:hypothetical protein